MSNRTKLNPINHMNRVDNQFLSKLEKIDATG